MPVNPVMNARKLIGTSGLCIAMLLVLSRVAVGQQCSTGWNQYGGSADNSHYLDLKQINKKNVTQLQQALYTEEPEDLGFGMKRVGTPGGIIYEKNCQACHGANRQGGMGPSLVDINNRSGMDAIRSIIVNGKGQMPGFSTLSDSEADSLMAYLADPTGSGGTTFARPSRMANANSAAVPPNKLVVASGDAPAGKEDPGRKIGPIGPYGIMGGPPYPADVHAPSERYYSDWNVMYKYINPPWSSLTAYDLNTGTIKWQIPIGEEAEAVKLGAHDTGALTEQRGAIVTSTGLIFLASSDGKLRAYDDQTEKTLWTMQMPGVTRQFQQCMS